MLAVKSAQIHPLSRFKCTSISGIGGNRDLSICGRSAESRAARKRRDWHLQKRIEHSRIQIFANELAGRRRHAPQRLLHHRADVEEESFRQAAPEDELSHITPSCSPP
jgi:hypothetical protein